MASRSFVQTPQLIAMSRDRSSKRQILAGFLRPVRDPRIGPQQGIVGLMPPERRLRRLGHTNGPSGEELTPEGSNTHLIARRDDHLREAPRGRSLAALQVHTLAQARRPNREHRRSVGSKCLALFQAFARCKCPQIMDVSARIDWPIEV